MFNNSKKIIFLNILVIGLIFLLPYYIFGGKLFIGGDDTRLYYLFPYEWIKNISFFSWFSLSSLGLNNPNQFILPILILLIPIKALIQNPITINYFIFSAPLIFGLISFQLLVSEIAPIKSRGKQLTFFLGSLFYIFSPIIMFIQLSLFLYSVWLIGLLPLLTYFFIKFLKTSNLKYVFFAVVSSIVFSISMISVPWILGFALSFLPSLAVAIFLYSRKDYLAFFKKTSVFFGILTLSQSFWFLPFFLNFAIPDKSVGSQVLDSNSASSFTSTVLGTASGNIIFPLLNLFHRKIAFDFNWSSTSIFSGFYDKTYILNLFFVLILFFSFVFYNKIKDASERKILTILLIAFLSSLFFFTVNIGFLKYVFLAFGYIPGFIMFANFWNKFDLAYILLYSILITMSLLLINIHIKNKLLLISINGIFFFLVIFNALPLKDLINAPLWTTKNIYSNITVPDEYMDFMNKVKKEVSFSSNILTLPLNIASYSFIKSKNSNELFIGTSPVKLFTGINDFSGDLSFSPQESSDLDSFIQDRDYIKLNRFLEKHNIDYVFITKNLPNELKNSYLFETKTLELQDDEFLNAIVGKKVIESSKDNYELFSTKNKSFVLMSDNLYFQKLSPVKYKLYIKNLRNPQDLLFLDSFSGGWKLYLRKSPSLSECKKINEDNLKHIIECGRQQQLFAIGDLGYSLNKPVFEQSHDTVYDYANSWTLDPQEITSGYSKDFYSTNPDGSINIAMTLYFQPQNYFYFGTILTALTIISLGLFLIKKRK